MPDLSVSPDHNSLKFLIDNMLVSGPLGNGHENLIKSFLEENVEPDWIRNLTRCAARNPDGGCSKLLVVLIPMIPDKSMKTLKDELLELNLVDLMVRNEMSKACWYGLAQLINNLPLEILYQSHTVMYGLDKYTISKIRPFIDNIEKYEALCYGKKVEVLIGGGEGKTVFIHGREFIKVFMQPFDIFKQTWPVGNLLLTPGYHIPLGLLKPLINDRPEGFFGELSRDAMFAIIDFLLFMGMKRGTQAVSRYYERISVEDGMIEIKDKSVHCDEIARVKALATQFVFLELIPTLTLKDLQDIQRVGGNDILAYFLPFVQDETLLQLELENASGLFKNRIQAKKQLYVPGMIPFKFLKPSCTSPEFLKKYSKEILSALRSNQTGDAVNVKRIVPALACMDDLSYEDRVLLQWS